MSSIKIKIIRFNIKLQKYKTYAKYLFDKTFKNS